MRINVILLFLVSTMTLTRGQSPKTDCHKVADLVEEIGSTYYWGSPKWLALMDSAISLCPTSANAWGDKSIIYMMRGDVATWYQMTEKAVRYEPLFFLGNRAYHRMRYLRDYEGALKDLYQQDSVAHHQTIFVSDTHNYMLIGQCKEGMGDFSSALDYYNRSIEIQTKLRGANWVGTYDYLIRGILKYKMNDVEGALADFDHQVKINDQLSDVYYYRGLAYKKLEQKDLARADLEKAKSLLTGQGSKRWDQQVILPNEVFLSDVDEILTRLN